MNDATLDLAALTALCQAHPGPYSPGYPTDDPYTLDVLTRANAVPELLALLAAAQEDASTWHNALDRQLAEYEAFRQGARDTLGKANAHILQLEASLLDATGLTCMDCGVKKPTSEILRGPCYLVCSTCYRPEQHNRLLS